MLSPLSLPLALFGLGVGFVVLGSMLFYMILGEVNGRDPSHQISPWSSTGVAGTDETVPEGRVRMAAEVGSRSRDGFVRPLSLSSPLVVPSRCDAANVLLGNDVMDISSLLLGQDPNDSLASAIAVAGDKGLTGGVGTPTRIGGNTQPALQRLFPARGRPAQVLRRAAGLSKAVGYFSGVLEAKAAIDLALTAGLAVACR